MCIQKRPGNLDCFHMDRYCCFLPESPFAHHVGWTREKTVRLWLTTKNRRNPIWRISLFSCTLCFLSGAYPIKDFVCGGKPSDMLLPSMLALFKVSKIMRRGFKLQEEGGPGEDGEPLQGWKNLTWQVIIGKDQAVPIRVVYWKMQLIDTM
jgi:hypothetical protein